MPADDLSALKDVHLPAEILFWPPAPGWYILIFLLAFIIGMLLHFVYKKIRTQHEKQEALALLAQYQKEFNQTGDVVKACENVNILLKRICLTYYPREHIAHLWGKNWVQFLNQTTKQIDFNPFNLYLACLPYQPQQHNFSKSHMHDLFDKTREFIRYASPPIKVGAGRHACSK